MNQDEAGARLSLRDVTVRFGGLIAVDHVNLDVRPGEVCGLIGPNGAGKTTLFDIIAGVHVPKQGRLVFDGKDITRLPSAARAHLGIKRTFQRVQTYGWLSVEDNVLVGLESGGGGGGIVADLLALPPRRKLERTRRERVAEVLELCGLTEVNNELASALPIGLGRMVELASAMAARPHLLLLDEPTSGLGGAEVERIKVCIRNVLDGDCSVIVVEHDIRFVMDQCHRIVVLSLGRVIADGTPAEVQNNAEVQASYLG